MELGLAGLIVLGIMILLLILGNEVFVAMGVAAAVGLVFFSGKSIEEFGSTAFASLNSYSLAALPSFIFMGAMLSNTGIVARLFDAADKWVGSMPGGIASSVVGANAIFGAMCGSTVAATATFGKIAYPEMERLGYSPKLSLGVLAASGVLSAAIPPSGTLIVYGSWAFVSLPRLFAATLIPGIILAIMFMLFITIRVTLNPALAPKPPKYPWRERLIALRNLIPWLALIAVVLGVIFGGIMTPTESGAMGAIGSIVLALAFRKFSLNALKASALTAVKVHALAGLLIITSKVLGMVLQYAGSTDFVTNLFMGLPFGTYGVIVTMYIMYFIGGMFIDEWAMLLLTLPFILPVLSAFGISPIWFGVFYVMVEATALITPPFGLDVFVLHTVIPKYDVMTISFAALPFLVPMVITAALIIVFPDLALWLPDVLYTRR